MSENASILVSIVDIHFLSVEEKANHCTPL
jgi:hypothetical protein